VADAAMNRLGLPMSPLALIDLVGPAVAYHVAETMHGAFPERFYVSPNMGRAVAAGKKAFRTTAGDSTSVLDPEVVALFEQGDAPLTADQVHDRAVDALSDEIRRMLDDGVVAEVQDIDLCMIMGAGWPFWLGGISPYLDRCGSAERVTGRRFLAPGVASVPV
jgi:3-hydroxyacyl-CoA dehydrogenase